MKLMSLKNELQALNTNELQNIKGGWLRGIPNLPPLGPGGIGGTPPPVTSNSNGHIVP